MPDDNTPDPPSDLLAAALRLAEAGYFVFPCEPGGKRPLVKGGFRAATLDPDQIRKWWEDRPYANPAIATGASGITVVDLDVDHETGECIGEDTWAVLQIEEDITEPDLVVKTPRGGLHLYYSGNEGVPATSRRLGDGIDTRAQTGYVLAPGAVVNDISYQLQGDLLPPSELTRTPEAIPRRIAEARSGLVGEHDDPSAWLAEVDLDCNVEKARSWLETEGKAGRTSIHGQGGSDLLYRTSCMLRDFALSPETAGHLLQESGWNEACEPPWSPGEIETHVRNAYRYARRPAGSKATSQSSLDTMADRAAEYGVVGNNVVQMGSEKPADSPKRRGYYTIAEMLALRPPEMLVPQLGIPAVGYYELIGPMKSFKTTLALDLAMHMAAGFSSWNGLKLPGRKLRIVWFAGEAFPKLSGQIKRFLDYHKLDPSDLDTFMPYDGIPTVTNEKQMKEIFAKFNGMRIDVFFWDTLARALGHLSDRNEEAGPLARSAFDRCAKAFGAVSIILRHAIRGEERGKGDTQLSNDGDGQAYIWKDKTEGTVHLKPLEMRWAPDDGDLVRTWTIHIETAEGLPGGPCSVPRLHPRHTQANPEEVGERLAKEMDKEERQKINERSASNEEKWMTQAKRLIDELWAENFGQDYLPIEVGQLAEFIAGRLGVNRKPVREVLRSKACRRPGSILYGYVFKTENYRNTYYTHPDWLKDQLADAKGELNDG